MNNPRNGKIARLPETLRNQLNRRLADAEPGESLLDWLNALPEVRAILAAQFNGNPISKQNLSEWRAGGFLAWQIREDFLAQAQNLAMDATQLRELAAAGDGSRLTDHLATVLAARYASLLAHWDGEVTESFTQKLRALGSLCRAITQLRRGDQALAHRQLTEPGVATACRHSHTNTAPLQAESTHPPTPAKPASSPLPSDSVKPSQTNPPVAPPQKPAIQSPSPILHSTFLIPPSPQPGHPPQVILPDLNDYSLLAIPAGASLFTAQAAG